jgi:hypothetical protein
VEHEHIKRQQDNRSGAKGDPMHKRDRQVLALTDRDSTVGNFSKQ